MKIHCGNQTIETRCDGRCMCHAMDMTFGGGREGCCAECGCPQTVEAFNRAKAELEDPES